jgi:putative FmdB family regulatory protein
MPIYEYRCRNGHDFEVFQSMTEDPVSRCPECAAPVERVFRPVAVHFKGKGFYTTDYARATASDGQGPAEKKEADKAKADKTKAADGKSRGSSDGKAASGEKSKPGSNGD